MTVLLWGTPLIKPTLALVGHVHSVACFCRHVGVRLNTLQRGYKVFTTGCFFSFLSNLAIRHASVVVARSSSRVGHHAVKANDLCLNQVAVPFERLFFWYAAN